MRVFGCALTRRDPASAGFSLSSNPFLISLITIASAVTSTIAIAVASTSAVTFSTKEVAAALTSTTIATKLSFSLLFVVTVLANVYCPSGLRLHNWTT